MKVFKNISDMPQLFTAEYVAERLGITIHRAKVLLKYHVYLGNLGVDTQNGKLVYYEKTSGSSSEEA